MEWVNEFVKMLKGSITVALALFIATLVTLVLPMAYPGSFPVIPDIWRIPVQLACLFSFVLVALWGVDRAARACVAAGRKLRKLAFFNPLSDDEEIVLRSLWTGGPFQPIDLNKLPTANNQRAAIERACRSLEKKGLVDFGAFGLVSMTRLGSERALEAVEAAAKKAAEG